VLLMAPGFPHITEEMWHWLGHTESVHLQAWPQWDAELAKEDEITIVVQVNGKVRERFNAPADVDSETVIASAKALPGVQKYTEGKKIVKEIYVPGKLVNIVVR